MNTTRLFQYGSNMAEAVLRQKIAAYLDEFAPPGTSAEVALLGAGRLPGWRFLVDLYSARGRHRVADIVEADPADEVWGAVYEIPSELIRRGDRERSVMDRIEGHRTSHDPENYRPIRVNVELAGDSVEAWTYAGCYEARERCRLQYLNAPVAEEYIRAILDGATGVHLAPAYVARLREILDAP